MYGPWPRGGGLDAIVIEEIVGDCRRAKIAAPPPDMAGNRIEFAMLTVPPQARLWLFVIDAEYGDGAPSPGLVDALLRHGRGLGDRAPIDLVWDHPGTAQRKGAGAALAALRPASITFDMLGDEPDPGLLPPLDQPGVDLADLTPEQRAWRQDGVVVLRKFFPNAVLDPYIARRAGWIAPAGGRRPRHTCVSTNCARFACILRCAGCCAL